METDATSGSLLSEGATLVIWRIFGSGESSLTQLSTYQLIEPIINKHVARAYQDETIAEIRTWFELHGDRWWLREDMRETVAGLILSGVGDSLSNPKLRLDSETVFWAVGSVEASLSASVISSTWSPEAVNLFVSHAFNALEKLCGKDALLDAGRMGYGLPNAKPSMESGRAPRLAEEAAWVGRLRLVAVSRGLQCSRPANKT